MSILDSINEAEERAAQMRQDEKAESRERVRMTEAEAIEIGQTAILEAQKEMETALEKARKAAAATTKAALEKEAEENRVIAEKARTRVPAAVSFILERVEML